MRRLVVGLALILAACGGSSRAPAHLEGTVVAVDGQTVLVDKSLVVISPTMRLDAAPGARVTVDGSWGAAGQLVATDLRVDAPAPSPTMAPTAPALRQPAPAPARARGKDKD